MIILFASAFFLAVAGALHPPIWEMTQEVETMVRAGYGMGGPATSGRVSLKNL